MHETPIEDGPRHVFEAVLGDLHAASYGRPGTGESSLCYKRSDEHFLYRPDQSTQTRMQAHTKCPCYFDIVYRLVKMRVSQRTPELLWGTSGN